MTNKVCTTRVFTLVIAFVLLNIFFCLIIKLVFAFEIFFHFTLWEKKIKKWFLSNKSNIKNDQSSQLVNMNFKHFLITKNILKIYPFIFCNLLKFVFYRIITFFHKNVTRRTWYFYYWIIWKIINKFRQFLKSLRK